MRRTCTIIGGGTGGLFTGALLAKEGYLVTVLDKNPVAGGGLQMFSRSDVSFETGMHVVAGHKDSLFRVLIDHLGIGGQVEVIDTDREASDSIFIASEGLSYNIPWGREAFEAYLCAEFPEEECGIRAYVDEIFRILESVPLLGHGKAGMTQAEAFAHDRRLHEMTADEFVGSYVRNPELRALLGYLNLMSGTVAGKTPAFVHAVINALYISGSGRLAGGPSRLAGALCGIITSAGGQVITGEKVTAINSSGGAVTSVTTSKGHEYSSDLFVWACSLRQLAAMAGEACFSRVFLRNLGRLPDSFSAFVVFLRLKKDRIPYVNRSIWWHRDMASVWKATETGPEGWPASILCMTPPSMPLCAYADRMMLISPMDFRDAAGWDGGEAFRRACGYGDWKHEMTEKVLSCIETVIPGLREMCDEIFASSPLSVRDWYGEPCGAIYGISRDCGSAPFLSPRTRLRNMFLAGQDLGLHGLCGAAASAVNAASLMTGRQLPGEGRTNIIQDNIC